MAALVSHEMRRYPLSPLSDGKYSYNLRGDNPSWSQPSPEEGESALSRSMRYADPWLYGSVRGAPTGAFVLAPAFVLCSCPDYINGTKKSTQKKGPTICKKCKGTRVALAPGNVEAKFGTVRCYNSNSSTTALQSMNMNKSQVRAGTVRVTSSSRASILPDANDPYDLMRRSRLNATSEGTSPFRGRSVSPTKKTSSGSTGRRSILECDINPYELMSSSEAEQKQQKQQQTKDTSITLVNGQRIRVRPPAPDPDYEDVEESPPKKSPILKSVEKSNQKLPNRVHIKPNRTAPAPPQSSSPSFISNVENEKNNSFKSILKKSSNFDCNESSISSPSSPARSGSGSHFYLPLPNTPRKKVQFLVVTSEDQNGEEDILALERTVEEKMQTREVEEYLAVFEDEIKPDEKVENKVCTLRRTKSERLKPEPPKVVFLDTMALRVKPQRGDTRDTFQNCDLAKLDGIHPKRKISPRPRGPPPLPPITTTDPEIFSKQDKPDDGYGDEEEIENRQKNEDFEEIVKMKQNRNAKIFAEQVIRFSFQPSEDNEQDKILDELRKLGQASKPSELSSSSTFETKVDEEISKKLSSPKQPNSDQQNGNLKADCTMQNEQNIPAVPPRKKSGNKQPVLTIQTERHLRNKFNIDESGAEKKQSEIDKIAEPKNIDNFTNSISELSNLNQDEEEIKYVQIKNIQGSSDDDLMKKSAEYSNKTIVKITPNNSIHKIQIRNEFPEVSNIQNISVSDNTQRKTSILINGDDCYSTVNVSDDIPLYQSSVVVRDHGTHDQIAITPDSPRKSSSVYITGAFKEHSLFSDKPIIETSDSEKEELCNKHKNEVTKEEKELSKEVSTEDELCQHNRDQVKRPTTPDMLREILRNPVEAVRRNLVPHICGKSDISRRPRDLKFKNYDHLMISRSESASPSHLVENNNKEHQRSFEYSPLKKCNIEATFEDERDACSEHSSSTQYEFIDPGSDCYTDHSNRSSVTEEELSNRTKFYELLADSSLLEISENDDHHYECISKSEPDPIYEEIEIPPPLPSNPPPINLLDDLKLDKEFTTRSIFEGASKYDILSYLVHAKERGIVPEDSYTFSSISNDESRDSNPKICHLSTVNDSSEENSLVISEALREDKNSFAKSSEVERNDSGVGSETSKSSLSKYRSKPVTSALCEDCESALEALGENEPLLCRKCYKKRSERKEIILEIVETEEKYSKDLQIVLEEFYQPMLVAGLLTPEQLSTIFLNAEELLENSQSLAERLRDAVEIATEQGDEDLLTVNIGKLFLEAVPMLHAFETYCVRQGPASLLLASLEKEKELLRIFLRVSQMENTLLRRMNLNSFLMVPVQRVTKYPLLLARLYKVTSNNNEAREQLKEAQHTIELHLNHMNSQTKDVPSKLWRRIGNSSGRLSNTEMDLVNIKLRKIAVDVLEWNHDEAKFALEGKLWFTQPTDNNWRKGRTIKLSPVNALLVINGKPTCTSKIEREDNALSFPKHSPTREAALLLVREKNGRYSLLRDPLYLDRCVVASDPAWQSYFEVQELLGKDTFIFKAEDEDQTKSWYHQLQFQAQGMGAWRKRRNALANIMMNGMGLKM